MMTGFIKAGLLSILALVWVAPAGAAMHWKPEPASNSGMQHDRMAAKHFMLHNGDNASVRFMHADLEVQNVLLENGQLALKPTGKNNYHVLVAKREHGNVHETAIRYLFLHGKPTGHSPSELTAASKAELEIVPSPLPREHWHYQGNQQAHFQILFQGKPLVGHAVAIETSHGAVMQATTDAQGMFQITVPDDFTLIKKGRMHNPPAEWRITVQHEQDGQQYSTILTAPYYVDPNHWQPLSWGLMAVGVAMLLALFVLIRRQKKVSSNKRGRR
ncbi:MAG: hypothetical protein Q9M17_04505 [Mariprofundus sp.]|nr:hypothetical protein [Mariprofundus sp.]